MLIAHARWTFFWKIIEEDINIKIWRAQAECSCAPGPGHSQEKTLEGRQHQGMVLFMRAGHFLKIIEKDINIKIWCAQAKGSCAPGHARKVLDTVRRDL